MTWEFVFKRHHLYHLYPVSLYRDFKPVSVGKPHNVRRHFCKRSGPDRQDCETLVKRNTRPKCSNCMLLKSPHHKTLIIFSQTNIARTCCSPSMALIIGGESVQGHLKDWSLPKLKLGDGECNDDGGGNSDGDDHGDNGDGDDDDRCSP